MLQALFGYLVLLYAIGAVIIFLIVQQSIYRKFDESLRQKLLDFASETIVIESRDPNNPRQTVRTLSLHDFFHAERCQLRDGSGRLLLSSKKLDGRNLPAGDVNQQKGDLELENLQASKDWPPGKIGFITFVPKRVSRRQLSRDDIPANPIKIDDREMHLAIAMSTEEERHTLQILALTMLVMGAFMGAAIYLIVQKQVEKSYRPIDQLVELTGSMRPEELSQRLPFRDLPEELSPLVKQFNVLLDQLESAFERERSFSASLGHEVRTPIAELSALLENAVDESREDDYSEDPAQTFLEASQISQRMTQLIEVISSIHHADSGRELVRLDQVDAGAVLIKVTDAQAEAIKKAKLSIKVVDDRGANPPDLMTDHAIVQAIVRNLISNAIDHSQPKTEIKCWLGNGTEPSSQVIRISNVPADLSSDDLKHLSQPFWRKDKSRSDQIHFGLGLSLVRVYADLLEADLQFELKKGKLIVSLKLPNLEVRPVSSLIVD